MPITLVVESAQEANFVAIMIDPTYQGHQVQISAVVSLDVQQIVSQQVLALWQYLAVAGYLV